MKTWLVVVVFVTLGVGLGTAGTMIELGATPKAEFPIFKPVVAPAEDELKPGPISGSHATIEFDEESFDAGVIEKDGEYQHPFIFHNRGNLPLRVKEGKTSCKCTLSKLKQDSVPPGEQAEVILSWHPTRTDPQFAQTAEIRTNDPARPLVTLHIRGRVLTTHAIVPEELTLGTFSVNESRSGQVRLFGYHDGLRIERWELADPAASEFFDVKVTPLAVEELMAEDINAKSGFLVGLTVKPGLPLGPIHQRILLHTNLPADGILEVPIHAVLAGDITVYGVGCRFSSEENVLWLDSISRDQGSTSELLLRVKGPDRKQANLKVLEVEPAEMKVVLGEPRESDGAAATKFALTIVLPENLPPLVRLGPQKSKMGVVVLETGLKSAPQVKIYVSFAIK